VRLILGLLLLGWLVEQRWAQALLAAMLAIGLVIAIRVFVRDLLEAQPEPTFRAHHEPQSEFSTHGAAEGQRAAGTRNRQRDQEPSPDSADENPFADMDEAALAQFIAGLIRMNEALEGEIGPLREQIQALEIKNAEVLARLQEAENSGRDRVLHAFGHDRDEFERMLRAFAHRRGEQRRQEGDRKRREQARRRAGRKRSWWEILGVSQNATEEEVRRAYRALAMKHHPDRLETGDPAKMAEINAARDEAMRRFRTPA
jgi:DnaJ-domain-containing protein 1